MPNNKLTEVRHHMLGLLERGDLTTGQRLPGSRELAATLGVSFLKVQQAVETLCKDCVLESISRKGTFVQHGWKSRVLRENLVVHDDLKRGPFPTRLLEALSHEIAGLRRLAELRDAIGPVFRDGHARHDAFLQGQAAMLIHHRGAVHDLRASGNPDWAVAPLPLMPDGEDVSAQATDLLCVRDTCPSPSLARHYVRAMLSEPVQDLLASSDHAIPIRRSSASRALDLGDPRDALFAVEMGKSVNTFHLAPPCPATLVLDGIDRLLDTHRANLEAGVLELAQAARTWFRVYGGRQPNSTCTTAPIAG